MDPPRFPGKAEPTRVYEVPAGQECTKEGDMSSQQASKRNELYRKAGSLIFNLLFYAFIIALVGGSALFALSRDVHKSYFGYRLYTVKTPSMTPQKDGLTGGFRVGDTVLVELCDPHTIQVGDIVTYVPGSDPSIYLTHRVVKVLDHLNDDKGLFFVTKGDANPSEDPPIAAKVVVGKVAYVIPGAGRALDFIRANVTACLIAIISSIGSIILLRMYLSKPDDVRPAEALSGA